MIVSDITKYFLWFFIFNIAQYPHKLFASYLERCGKVFRYTDYETLIGPVCSTRYPRFITCIENNLSKRVFEIDKIFYNSIDFVNIGNKTTKFCNKFHKFDVPKAKCDNSNIRATISSKLCADDHLRLEYLKLDKCPINIRLSWFAYRDSTFRNGCKMVDPWYQIIPKYGPDVLCYRDFIQTYADMRTDNTSLVEVYETFCQQFNYESIFSCVNRTFNELNYHEFGGLEKKRKYECTAKMFVEKRRELCERFSQLKQNPRASDLRVRLKCKRLLATIRTSSMEILAKKYSKCLNIDSTLAQLVYDNLMSYKDIDHCRANSSYFEFLISTKNAAGFHYPILVHLFLISILRQVAFMQ